MSAFQFINRTWVGLLGIPPRVSFSYSYKEDEVSCSLLQSSLHTFRKCLHSSRWCNCFSLDFHSGCTLFESHRVTFYPVWWCDAVWTLRFWAVVLGGVMVIVGCLPLYARFAGSNPAENDGFLRTIKVRSTTSFGGKVYPWALCRKTLCHVKETYRYEKRYLYVKFNYHFSPSFSPLWY
jgi:hypothetical protein